MDIFGKSEIQKTYLERVEIPEKQLEQYKIQKGDVLFVRSSVKREGVGQSCLVNDDFEDTVYSGFIIRFREKSNTLYHLYKKYCFAESSFRKEILSFATSSANTNINQDSLSQILLFYPSIAEQEKIASFLGAVERRLTQLCRKQELLQTYKRSVMQKIFPQQIRFTQPDGSPFPDWEYKELGEVLDYEQPTNYLVSSTEYNDFFSTPVLTAGKTFLLGYSNETDNVFSKLPTIIFDDFTTSFKFVNFPFKAKSSAMKMLLPKNKNINIKYIFEIMNTLKFSVGEEHKRYWISEYQHLEIAYPVKEEQEKIANFLTAIDRKIEALSHQIDQTEQFRKGLLQKMFV